MEKAFLKTSIFPISGALIIIYCLRQVREIISLNLQKRNNLILLRVSFGRRSRPLAGEDDQSYFYWSEKLFRPVFNCLLYTSDAADEEDSVDLGGRRIIKKKK